VKRNPKPEIQNSNATCGRKMEAEQFEERNRTKATGVWIVDRLAILGSNIDLIANASKVLSPFCYFIWSAEMRVA
jgi:hypothetical protein